MPTSLALIGCGKMGQALLKGWLNKKLDYSITVVQPDPLPENFPQAGYNYIQKLNYSKTFDIIVFAVKPQILDEVMADYTKAVHDTTLVLSIAAGKGIESLESIFGKEQPIIRTMPNTPAAIGKGMTALTPNRMVSDVQKKMAEELFQACGKTVWVESEDDMNAVTAVSGSGPAYIFYFIEALTKAAIKAGLSLEQAKVLARQTVIGAGGLAEDSAEIEAANLRKNVASPGGTTEAALEILMDGRLQEILSESVAAAKKRGEELNS